MRCSADQAVGPGEQARELMKAGDADKQRQKEVEAEPL
jgi:hypothetical protein